MIRVNFHSHSTCSDGKIDPEELAKCYHKNHVELVALTDHDTIRGMRQFIKYTNNLKVKVITGIELSVDYSKQLSFTTSLNSFHMLAYDFDLNLMESELNAYFNQINQSIERLVNMLKQEGYPVSMEDLPSGIEFYTKTDIANILVRKKLAKNVTDVFIQIINQYPQEKSFKYTDKMAIDIIHKCKGKAFIAHPYDIFNGNAKIRLNKENVDEFVQYAVDCGIDGIESNYQPFCIDMQDHLNLLATEYNLFTSYGTDFHAKRDDEALFIEIDKLPDWIRL